MKKTNRSELAKKIINLAKAGKTTQEVLITIGMSKSQLRDEINWFSEKNRRFILSSLEANDKRAKKCASHKAAVEQPATEEKEAAEEVETELPEELQAQIPQAPTMEEREKSLSQEAMDLEREHNKYFGKRHEIVILLRKEKEAVDELIKLIAERKAKVFSLVEEADALAAEMKKCSAKHFEVSKKLEEIRAMLKKINILIYKDGRFEAWQGDQEFDITAYLTGWEQKRQEIIDDQSGDYQDLTLWQIPIVAKMLTVRQAIIEAGYEADFSLDNGIEQLTAFLP